MRILPFQSHINVQKNNFAQRQYNNLSPLKSDTISFSFKKSISPMYDDFTAKMAEVYPNQEIEDVLREMISKEENRLGEGVKKVVYTIDGVEDYVVAFMKKGKKVENSKLVPVKDPFPGFNFSQEIATNNGDMLVMKRIYGDVHSVSDWTKKYQGVVYRDENITQDDAQFFLSKISELESLPTESFVDFAKQVKYLTDRRIKIDMFNPNNIIVDPKSKKITYFDLFENPAIFHSLGQELNCTQDMINVLCDALLHGQYMRALDEQGKEELFNKTQSIAEKCRVAGRQVGLSDDNDIAYRTYEFLQNRLHQKDGRNTKYVELYGEFQDLYGID